MKLLLLLLPALLSAQTIVPLEDFSEMRQSEYPEDLWQKTVNNNGQTFSVEGGVAQTIVAYGGNDIGSPGGDDYARFDMRTRAGDTTRYRFPEGFAQHFIESGTWDSEVEAMRYRVKSTHSYPFNVGRNWDIGVYMKAHTGGTNAEKQSLGFHYYHFTSHDVTPDEWVVVLLGWAPNASNAPTGWSRQSAGFYANPEWVEPNTYIDTVRTPLHYWDALLFFYMDYEDAVDFPYTFQMDDIGFYTPTGRNPWNYVASMALSYTGTQYNLSFNTSRWVTSTYDVYYSDSSMKVNGLTSGAYLTNLTGTQDAVTGIETYHTDSRQATRYYAVRPRMAVLDITGGGGGGVVQLELKWVQPFVTGDEVTLVDVCGALDGSQTITALWDGGAWESGDGTGAGNINDTLRQFTLDGTSAVNTTGCTDGFVYNDETFEEIGITSDGEFADDLEDSSEVQNRMAGQAFLSGRAMIK